jgi:RNA polymerase sigma-70 factor, ECF subfamily
MSVPTPTFREVYLASFDYVWGVLRRLGVREQDTQDTAQKVFLVVYLKLPQFEHRSLLRTWLFRICLNAASDYRRSAPIRCEIVTGPDEIDLLAGSRDDLLERSESRRRVSAAEAILNKLPQPQRVVFVMFELEHMSGPEIAELLDISLGTVRSRLRLAREAFTRDVSDCKRKKKPHEKSASQ